MSLFTVWNTSFESNNAPFLFDRSYIEIGMNEPIAKAYNPKEFENRIYRRWETHGSFKADVHSAKKPFTISLPPPNATGQLHVGHAVMLAIEDVLIRWHRMLGDEALWVPGTDHAAIATENLVINMLQSEEGIDDPRNALGREKLLERIARYVQESRETIRSQIRAMGASCDWSRERYTMDPQLNRCVNHIFIRMFEEGLIYRGHRIVNWDHVLQTTISDDEIEHETISATLYYLRYGPFVIATSRPETKLGDTGVAVHPADKRYQRYLGKTIEVEWPKGPIIQVKVFADERVDSDFGSGVIGVTPGHSQVDFQMSRTHDLNVVQVIGEDGKMLETAGVYQGMTVKECREAFVKDLEAYGLIEKKESYDQPLSICYRSKQPIEPLPKEQWFIDVNRNVIEWKGRKQSLKEILLDVVQSGQIRIVPERFEDTYFHWIENLQDWCISRQIWWGHRIPIWYRGSEICPFLQTPEEEGWFQDPDTLDTWFSSALWTWSTLIDPEVAQNYSFSFDEMLEHSADFQKFHPTQVMETGYDILFFWVARMILMTVYMIRDIPFETVYLHGLVRTRDGKKMSKSDPDTCIDPLESIQMYGADALRIALISGTAPGMDLRIYPEKLESCRRFVNKIWNAARFVLLTIPPETSIAPPLDVRLPVSQWILHRLNEILVSIQKSLENFRLSDVVENLRTFLWGEFCDWYLEMSKKKHRTDEDNQVLAYTYTTLLKLLHPYMPFVTEVLWEEFNASELLIRCPWPQPLEAHHFPESANRISLVQQVIIQIRTLREKAGIGLNVKSSARIYSEKHALLFQEHEAIIKQLARLENLYIKPRKPDLTHNSLSSYFEDTVVRIEATVIDWQEEIEKLNKKLRKEEKFLLQSRKKLENDQFLKKAPEHVISQLRDKVDSKAKLISALEQQILKFENRN